jgi:membrane-associated phospholipid phosphatase
MLTAKTELTRGVTVTYLRIATSRGCQWMRCSGFRDLTEPSMAAREPESLEAAPSGRLAAKHRPQWFAPASSRSLCKPLLWIALAAATCVFLAGVSVRFIDRPVATWVHAHLGDTRFGLFKAYYDGHLLVIGPFSLMAGPAQVLVPLATLVFAILAAAAAAGWRPNMLGRIVLALSLSVLVAVEINSLIKSVFGRTWPESWLGDNPSWIRDGVFGFFPFHGGPGWGSFPSGHTTVITTPAALLWVVWPELRIVWGTMVAVVIAGLVGANYHFVSDIIGGLYLGTAIGLGIAGLMLPPKDRLNSSILSNLAPGDKLAPLTEVTSPAIDSSRPPPGQA